MGRTPAGLREPLWAFAAATALAAALAALGAVVPFVRDNLHAPIAFIFLYTPSFAARRAGREFDYADAGPSQPIDNGAAVMLAAGYELFSGPFFAVDLQGRFIEGSYDGINDHVSALNIGLGFNWY